MEELSNLFFIIVLATIVVTRVFLYFKPIPSPTVGGFRSHHWMYGLLLSVVGLITDSVFIYGIGLGLFIDELTYLLIGGKTHEENYSNISLAGTVLFVILVYIFRDYLILPITN